MKYWKHLSKKGQKKRTVETKLSRIRVFLRYLGLHGIWLEVIDFQAIAGFYLFLSDEYAANVRSNIQFTLRDFLVFVENIGSVRPATSKLITTIYSNKHVMAHSHFIFRPGSIRHSLFLVKESDSVYAAKAS